MSKLVILEKWQGLTFGDFVFFIHVCHGVLIWIDIICCSEKSCGICVFSSSWHDRGGTEKSFSPSLISMVVIMMFSIMPLQSSSWQFSEKLLSVKMHYPNQSVPPRDLLLRVTCNCRLWSVRMVRRHWDLCRQALSASIHSHSAACLLSAFSKSWGVTVWREKQASTIVDCVCSVTSLMLAHTVHESWLRTDMPNLFPAD